MHLKQRFFQLSYRKKSDPSLIPQTHRVSSFSQLIDEGELRYSRAVHLCLITFSTLLLGIIINYFENNVELITTLAVVFAITLFFLVILLITRSGTVPLVGISLALMSLGGFLLCYKGGQGGSSLFWFLLLPPMLMFCVGLRLGTIFFFCFYLFLLLMMLTPLDSLLAHDLSWPSRWRFLASIFGIFLFSWLAEYTRSQTRRALVQAVQMLEHNSLTDPLTALGNRRDFQNYFMVNQAQLQRSNRMFSIAMVDLDFFKAINDTFGHAMGDQVLCHVSSLLAAYLRASDRIFRWGGEEFVILLPDTSADDARTIMERLCREVEISPYITKDGRLINVTISIGLHSGTLNGDVDKHIAAADEKLYLAKHSGRNQVRG